MSTPFPKIIWTFWKQGWSEAPALPKASLASWRRENPGWRVHALDARSIADFLPPEELADIFVKEREDESLSNQVRIRLLDKYGGVWVDATTICMQPLDEWLPQRMTNGFFAFANPGPDRLLSSWFMATVKGSYLVEQWSRLVTEYWKGRSQRHTYHWFHGELLTNLYESDAHARKLWDEAQSLPSLHRGHFGPDTPRLSEPVEDWIESFLKDRPAPVIKLTRKIKDDRPEDSLIDSLIRFGFGNGSGAPNPGRRLLAVWSGSLDEGSAREFRAFQGLVTYLVGHGHQVSHVSAPAFGIHGAARIEGHEVDSSEFDGVIVLSRVAAGMQSDRRLLQVAAGDAAGLAIAVQTPAPLAREASGPVIGLATAAGAHSAGLSAEADTLAEFAAMRVAKQRGGGVVRLESDPVVSGKTSDEIDLGYSGCDIVIASDVEGAIAAMRIGIPFIAIDPVLGGGEVFDLLSSLGWRHVYRIEHVRAAMLSATISEMLDADLRSSVLEARHRLVMDANRTLARIDDWIASLPER